MMRKYFIYLSLILCLLLSVTGCGGGAAQNEGEKNADKVNIKTDLGINFVADGLSNTVNYILYNWANPEDTYGFETADEGFRLVVVNLTITNTGTEEKEVNQLYYALDFGGVLPAEVSYYGSSASNISRLKTTKLAPGGSYTGDLLVEVPNENTLESWSIVYNSDPFGFKEDYEPTKVSLKK